MNDHFDLEAVTWDMDPARVERAQNIADQLRAVIPDTEGKTAMEIGCGTGLMSFCLQDHFSKIALVDSSQGMIKVLEEKINNQRIDHFKTFHLDFLELPDDVPRVDAIYSLLTLHHIRDYRKALKASKGRLLPGGYLCIADLEKEDGSFHAHIPGYDLHNGFERDHICNILQDLALDIVHNEICYVIDSDKSGQLKSFPLFLIIGKMRLTDR